MSTYIVTGGAGFIGCNIARELVRQKKGAAGKTMNISGRKTVNVNKIWETIAKLTNTKIKPKYAPPRTGEIYHSSADITKAQKHLNYQPTYNIIQGLKKTIEWHINKI